MPIIRGDKLPEQARKQVLASYVYRWTRDNPQRESAWRGIDGKPTIPLVSDEEWLSQCAFHVKADGTLDNRYNHAEPHYLAD